MRLLGLRDFWLGEFDLAPLGLFRIVYGILAFNWLWQLGQDLSEFFTDQGLLPRSSELVHWPDRFSLLTLFGEWWQVLLFWAVSLVAALFLVIGYRTRSAAIVTFLAIISFQQRNPLILDGSDLVFRVVPFWLIFTAAGGRFSVDAALRRARGERLTGWGPALPVRLLQLQVSWIYLATGFEKLAGKKWLDGTAAYFALQLKHTFGRSYVEPLVQFEPFVRAVTWFTMVTELGFGPAVFFPFGQPYIRLAAVLAAAAMHFGILTMMNVGNFPVIMLATLILFLPPGLVTRFMGLGRHLVRGGVSRVDYDGACAYCRRTALFLGAADLYGTVRLHDVRSQRERLAGGTPARFDGRVRVIDDRGTAYAGFRALTHLRGVPLLWPVALVGAIPGLSRLGELAYDRVAGRPGSSGWPGQRCELHPGSAPDRPPSQPAGWAPRTVAAAALVVVAIMALGTAVPRQVGPATGEPFSGALRMAALDQRWNMFSPDPASVDGWTTARGRLADGTLVELIGDNGRPRPQDPLLLAADPANVPRYADPLFSRWVKVQERMASIDFTEYRLEYGRMYCRMRNLHLQAGQSPLASFDVTYTARAVQPRGAGPDKVTEYPIWSHHC